MLDNLLVKINDVFHVGDLNESTRTGYSYEGNSLSVSTHPSAWIKINRITSEQVICLKNQLFLDVYKVKENKAFMQQIFDYALENSYAKKEKLYSYEFYDDNDDLCKVVVDDLSEIDEDCEYDEFIGLVATEKLLEYFEMKSIDSALLDDFLIMVYCLKETNINKFYWFDVLDVLNYSAPRGAIFGFNK